MSFGKRIVKAKKEVSNDSGTASKKSKEFDNKNNSIGSSDNNINSNDNITNISIKQDKVNQDKVKPKKIYNFMKKTSNKSSGLLFGQTKEEKLKLFIKNIKIIHPNMPDFWLQKESENFKKKFNIENDR